jgi:hypothetical protein
MDARPADPSSPIPAGLDDAPRSGKPPQVPEVSQLGLLS